MHMHSYKHLVEKNVFYGHIALHIKEICKQL